MSRINRIIKNKLIGLSSFCTGEALDISSPIPDAILLAEMEALQHVDSPSHNSIVDSLDLYRQSIASPLLHFFNFDDSESSSSSDNDEEEEDVHDDGFHGSAASDDDDVVPSLTAAEFECDSDVSKYDFLLKAGVGPEMKCRFPTGSERKWEGHECVPRKSAEEGMADILEATPMDTGASFHDIDHGSMSTKVSKHGLCPLLSVNTGAGARSKTYVAPDRWLPRPDGGFSLNGASQSNTTKSRFEVLGHGGITALDGSRSFVSLSCHGRKTMENHGAEIDDCSGNDTLSMPTVIITHL